MHGQGSRDVCAPRVRVTDRHVRCALHALKGTIADPRYDFDRSGGTEGVVMAAAVIAAIEAFGERVPESTLAQYNLVEEAMGRGLMKDYAMMFYGLVEEPEVEHRPLPDFAEVVEERLTLVRRSLAPA